MNEKPLERIRVVGLGQACIDYLGTCPFYPDVDSKIELAGLQIRCGGPASTALVTLSRLNVPTSFLGSVSDDPFGLKIVNNLQKEKVDITSLKIVPGYTSQFAFIAVNKDDGKRTIFWHRGSVPHLKADDVDLSIFPNAQILHIDSLMTDAAIEAARQAKAAGMFVVMDGGTMRKGTSRLVSLVDILIASETFATSLVGFEAPIETALNGFQKMGPGQVVITLGAKGSVGINDQGIIRQEAFNVKTVDTTGAGDVYHGGYIYGLLNGWEMGECMRFASACAALKCKETGAQNGISDIKAVRKFMEAR